MLPRTKPESQRVLVCDDERHIVRLLQVNLQRQGYLVTCAYDGREAIELLKGECFDLVVLDAEMPGVSGYEVRDWIAADDAKQTRVVMLKDEAKPLDRWPW